MQSDEEDFEESLETHSPVRRTEDRFPLRNTPARRASEKHQEKMESERQDLFEKLTTRSEETTGAAAFSSGISSTFENLETVVPKTSKQIPKPDYTPRQKADRLQKLNTRKTRQKWNFQIHCRISAEPMTKK